MLDNSIPLCLYIHIPWCVRKCPYCDFNSHPVRNDPPEKDYIACLIKEFEAKLPLIAGREIQHIFIGGGTPSLFSANTYAKLFDALHQRCTIANNAEITLEANPGTVEQARFKGYFASGINRLSLGVQSLQDKKLALLGRIHNREQVINAVLAAKNAGFHNFNIDIMFGLPQQNLEDALEDLNQAIALGPSHFSWYQLTLEPNTVFHKYPPPLPHDESIWEIQLKGQDLLAAKGYIQYEISAYSQPRRQCQHNLNYWHFGDYLGIGAGAHSKITYTNGEVTRHSNIKHPRSYLNTNNPIAEEKTVLAKDLPLDFMLNAARLFQPISFHLFEKTTGLKKEVIAPQLSQAQALGFLEIKNEDIHITKHGHLYLNDLLELFI